MNNKWKSNGLIFYFGENECDSPYRNVCAWIFAELVFKIKYTSQCDLIVRPYSLSSIIGSACLYIYLYEYLNLFGPESISKLKC